MTRFVFHLFVLMYLYIWVIFMAGGIPWKTYGFFLLYTTCIGRGDGVLHSLHGTWDLWVMGWGFAWAGVDCWVGFLSVWILGGNG